MRPRQGGDILLLVCSWVATPCPRFLTAESKRREELEAAEAAAVEAVKSKSSVELASELLLCALSLLEVENRRIAHAFSVASPQVRQQAAPTNSPLSSQLSVPVFNALASFLEAAFAARGDVAVAVAGAGAGVGVGAGAGLGAAASDAPSLFSLGLRAAHLLLERLKCSQASVVELELLPSSSAGVGDASRGMADLRSALLNVVDVVAFPVDRVHADGVSNALSILEEGFELFYPNSATMPQLLTDRLSAYLAGAVPVASPRYQLLCVLLKQAAHQPILPGLFGNVADPGSAVQRTASLKLLFDITLLESRHGFSAAQTASGANRGSGPRSLAASVCTVLNVFQEQLLVATQKAYGGVNPAGPIALREALVAYARQIIDCSTTLLAQAHAYVTTAGGAAIIATDVLSSSVVGRVLPLFGTALSLIDRDLVLAEALLPMLVKVIRGLDAVCCCLPDVVAAERALIAETEDQRQQEARLVSNDDHDAATAVHDSGLSSGQPPLLLDVELTLVSASARLCACMIAAVPEEEEEEHVSEMLKCAPLRGGLDLIDSKMPWSATAETELDPSWLRFLARLRVYTDAVHPTEWEVAMMQQADVAGSASYAGTTIDLATWTGFLVDLEANAECDSFHKDRNEFFSRLLSQDVLPALGKTAGVAVMEWLQACLPMSGLMRRKKITTYPDCELPYLACLLRHTSLWKEAEAALAALTTGVDAATVTPSPLLLSVWKRVVSLRTWLRGEKDKLDGPTWTPYGWTPDMELEYAAATAAMEAGFPLGDVAVGASAGVVAGGDPLGGVEETKSDERGPPALARSRSVRGGQAVRRRRRLLPKKCTSFDALRETVAHRAMLLLTTSSVTGDPVSDWGALASIGTTKDAPAQLKDQWSGLLPPTTLKPLLTRWKSIPDSVDTADSGDILAEADVSVELDLHVGVGGAGSAGAPPSSVDTVVMVGKSSAHYVCHGQAAHPDVVRALFTRRQARACQRLFGLKAQRALLGAVTFASAQTTALEFLRPAFRGRVRFVEELQASGRDAATDVSAVRHHYLKALEGCPAPLQHRVQAAFIVLYTHLSQLLTQAVADGNGPLLRTVIWNWGLDFEVGIAGHRGGVG